MHFRAKVRLDCAQPYIQHYSFIIHSPLKDDVLYKHLPRKMANFRSGFLYSSMFFTEPIIDPKVTLKHCLSIGKVSSLSIMWLFVYTSKCTTTRFFCTYFGLVLSEKQITLKPLTKVCKGSLCNYRDVRQFFVDV